MKLPLSCPQMGTYCFCTWICEICGFDGSDLKQKRKVAIGVSPGTLCVHAGSPPSSSAPMSWSPRGCFSLKRLPLEAEQTVLELEFPFRKKKNLTVNMFQWDKTEKWRAESSREKVGTTGGINWWWSLCGNIFFCVHSRLRHAENIAECVFYRVTSKSNNGSSFYS